MSNDFGSPNPFGEKEPFADANPYSSPLQSNSYRPDIRQQVRTKVMLPAIFLIIVAALAMVFDLLGVVMALTVEQQIDPNAPEVLQNFQRGMSGPAAALMQGLFAMGSLVIIVGAVQMLRFKTWGFALTVSILTMLNAGNCCCILGLPFGIWSLIVLNSQDVRAAFAQSS